MHHTIEIAAKDNHRFQAYVAEPASECLGVIIIVQEIFGVTSHIRAICDEYATDGYIAVAPSLFDRVKPGIELGYDDEGVRRGAELATGIRLGVAVRDLQATVDSFVDRGPVGIVGYCYGGTLAWLCASRVDGIRCVSSYYGGHVSSLLDLAPRVPIILHFGNHDPFVPSTEIDKIRAAYPNVPVYIYEAGHGFNCTEQTEYDAKAASLARKRTLQLFESAFSPNPSPRNPSRVVS